MGEKTDFTKASVFTQEFVIPPNYYIDINAENARTCPHYAISYPHYKHSPDGDCIITVYKSLDASHGSPPIEHIVKTGSFSIKNVKKMKSGDFLREIRQGIEKIISSDRETK